MTINSGTIPGCFIYSCAKESYLNSGVQSKITKHTKRQEDITHIEEKKQLIKTGPEITEFVDKDIKNIKIIIKTVFHILKNQAKIEKIKYRQRNVRKIQFKYVEIKLQYLR